MLPGLSYGPYQQRKESATRMTVGAATRASAGSRARLGAQGMGDVPGVADAAATRTRAALLPGLADIRSRIDTEYQTRKLDIDKFNEQLKMRQKEFDWQKRQAKIKFMADIAGIGLKVASWGIV